MNTGAGLSDNQNGPSADCSKEPYLTTRFITKSQLTAWLFGCVSHGAGKLFSKTQSA